MSSSLKVSALLFERGDLRVEADFIVAAGERVALTGPSGCGKTTLLRLIAGFESPIRGSVSLGGRDLTQLAPNHRALGVVFQDSALFPSMNALENAAFGLKIRGVPRKEREAKARQWLERVGLGSRIMAPVHTLSGGERSRVAWVRALIWEPQALLLDEPFSALDPDAKRALQLDLLQILAKYPMPVLIVTHDSADVQALQAVEVRSENGRFFREVVHSGASHA